MEGSSHAVLWYVFAALTVASALGVVLARSAISSAMALVATFFFLSGIYVLLYAHTIAVLQVLVYAGAIMVLFLFVIMLLSLTETGIAPRWNYMRVATGTVASAGVLFVLVASIRMYPRLGNEMLPSADFGSLTRVGAIIYTQYLLPFEVVSLLLLVAIVGAVVVAKPRI